MKCWLLLALAALLGLTTPALAGKYNRKLSVGDPAPPWTGLTGVDGKKHSLSDLAGKDVVVVVITCNHCPVAEAYEDRLIAFTKKFAADRDSKVAVVAINPSLEDEDKLPQMEERAKAKGFNFPYLYDETQQVGRQYGATVTPTVFVLDSGRKVVYMGAVDDEIRSARVKESYLVRAVEAVLAGNPLPLAETRPNGCSLQYLKK